MADFWKVQVAGQSYGPYPLDHMQAFIAEGRIVAKSQIAYGEEAGFHAAADDLMLAQFLKPEPVVEPEAEIEAEPEPAPEPVRRIEAPAAKFGRTDDADDSEPAHILIMADMKSRSINGLEEAIYSLGSAFPVLPQIWLLTTNESVNGIRNLLIQKLGKIDALFIVDATHDKAAWFNFGPEPEARIRRIWGKPDTQRKAG